MCCCMPYFPALIRHHKSSLRSIKSSIFARYRHARSAFRTRSGSSEKSLRKQHSSAAEFVKIDHSGASEKLPQIWDQNGETPPNSTAILTSSATTHSQDCPVESGIHVRTDLHQAWSPVLLGSKKAQSSERGLWTRA